MNGTVKCIVTVCLLCSLVGSIIGTYNMIKYDFSPQQTASTDMYSFDHTMQFAYIGEDGIYYLDIGLYEDNTGEIQIYYSPDLDRYPSQPEWCYYIVPDTEGEGIYYLFEDKEYKTYAGYIEIFKEDGEALHCDLYRPMHPVQSYLDISIIAEFFEGFGDDLI